MSHQGVRVPELSLPGLRETYTSSANSRTPNIYEVFINKLKKIIYCRVTPPKRYLNCLPKNSTTGTQNLRERGDGYRQPRRF